MNEPRDDRDESEKEPEAALPRMLGRWRVKREDGVIAATDTVGERRGEVSKLTFGQDAAGRDAAIARLRARVPLSHAALRAVLDAGPWGLEDAFVALEALGPTEPLEAFVERADAPARVRVVSELLGAASVLARASLKLKDVVVVVDAYGQPKLLGLEDAIEGDGELDARVLDVAASVDPDAARALRIRAARAADLEALGQELARAGKVVATSFASDAARGEAALDAPARSRQMQIALVVIALALSVIVAVAIAAR